MDHSRLGKVCKAPDCPKGEYCVYLGGIDPDGAAVCRLRWVVWSRHVPARPELRIDAGHPGQRIL